MPPDIRKERRKPGDVKQAIRGSYPTSSNASGIRVSQVAPPAGPNGGRGRAGVCETAAVPERSYDRGPADLRPVEVEPGFVRTADGSALYSQGETRIICTASITPSVPRFLEGKGRGWVTAEYAMLPASTGERKQRDSVRGRLDGRSVEIQRLIGRSLRAVVDLEALGERSVFVDCDVLQADGGTRCASITGGYVALRLALAGLVEAGELDREPLTGSIAAVSCGIVDGEPLCDLDYAEDSRAEVDANVVMSGDGGLVEVQATAERMPVSRASLDALLALAEPAIARLGEAQEGGAAAVASG
jgi:ribonuclease PH